MKKLVWLVGIVSATVLLLLGLKTYLAQQEAAQFERPHGQAAEKLTLFNWGDYLDPSLLTKFQKETGYQVNYETFDSNEAMYTKIKQGGTRYDLAIPSDYMIEKMKRADLLEPLDHSKLTGLAHYDSIFMDQPFDRHNRYSVPYFWGTLGIVYNDQMVAPGAIKDWNDLWRPEYRQNMMLVDSARDIMGIALVSSGHSVNTKSVPTLAAAKGKLTTLMPNVKAIVADEMKTYMAQNEAAIAVTYSGDAAEMMSRNEHLHYVVPKSGGNLWFDNMVIPKTVQNKVAAYAFINFMSRPENAAKNAEYVGYATPNQAAKRLLPAAVKNDRAWYPDRQTVQKLEVYQDLGPEWTQRYNDNFLEFKMSN